MPFLPRDFGTKVTDPENLSNLSENRMYPKDFRNSCEAFSEKMSQESRIWVLTSSRIYYFMLCQAEIKISNDDNYNHINDC